MNYAIPTKEKTSRDVRSGGVIVKFWIPSEEVRMLDDLARAGFRNRHEQLHFLIHEAAKRFAEAHDPTA